MKGRMRRSEGQKETNKVKTEMAGYETENEGYSE